MVLATRIKSVRRNRENVRIDEIGAVMDIKRVYTAADAASDNAIKARFQRLYNVADDDEERDAVTKLYMEWDASERREEFAVHGSVEEATNLLRVNNGYWLNDGCGPDGRAA